MCPACLAATALVAVGAASAGGFTVFAVTKFSSRPTPDHLDQEPEGEKKNHDRPE